MSEDINIRENEKVYKDIMSNISEIENTLSDINNKLTKLTANRNELFKEAGKYKIELQDALQKVEELQGRIVNANNKVLTLEREKSDLEAKLKLLESKSKEDFDKEKSGLLLQIEGKNRQIEALKKEKMDLMGEQEKYKSLAEKDLSNLQDLQGKIVKINEAIKNNNNSLEKLLGEKWSSVEKGTTIEVDKAEIFEVPGAEELQNQDEKDIKDLSKEDEIDIEIEAPKEEMPANEDAEELQLGGKKKPRLPIMYGGIKVPVWRKKKALAIFGKYKRSSLNKMATRWGISSPLKYKRKKDLAIAMKLLMHYRYGDLVKREQIEKVAKIVGLKPSKYKTKSGLKRAVNKKMKGLKMRGGSYFAAELKKGLLKKIKTPLLKGGTFYAAELKKGIAKNLNTPLLKGGKAQGNYLTMRKSSYLKGGKAQGNYLTMRKSSYLKGGSEDKILKLQKKRTEYEKKLSDTKKPYERDMYMKKIKGLNGLISKMLGGCGCSAGRKYRVGRGGSAPINYKMGSKYLGNPSRLGNNKGGKKRKCKK